MKTNVDKKLIVSLSTDSNTYENGKNIFLDDGIIEVVEEKISTGSTIKFKLDTCSVTIRVDHGGKMRGYGCTCVESRDFAGACSHCVAALFYLNDKNDNKGTKIKTDFISDELLTNFKKAFLSENNILEVFNKKYISLEPVINYNFNNKVFLTIKIGFKGNDDELKNFYVIKNIGEFVKNILDHEYHTYGKELAFVHNKDKFYKESRQLVELLISEKGNIDDTTSLISKNNTLIKQNNFSANKELYLTRDGFDKFFNIYSGQKVGDYMLKEEVPNIIFKGLVQEDKLTLSRSDREYFVHLGISNGYVVVNNTIHKVDMECALSLMFIYEAFEKTKNEIIQFKKDGVHDFLGFVLPVLAKYNLMESSYIDEFYKVGYLPVDIKLYLDMEGNNIIATLEFYYGETKITYGEITTYDGYRDKLREESMLEMLFYYGFVFENNNFNLKKEKDIFDFYKSGIYNLNQVCEVFITNNFKEKQYLKENVDTNVDIRISGDLLEMNINNTHYTVNELVEALAGYKINKNYFRLKNGKFVDLEDEKIKNTLGIINVIKNDIVNGEVVINKNKAYFINDLFEDRDITFSKDKNFTELVEKISNTKTKDIKFDESFNKILRHYQKDGIKWLKNLIDLGFGVVLADEMGLGKTIEIIGLTEVDYENNLENKPYLIVCPTSLVYNWKKEFEKFGTKSVVKLIVGNPMERLDIINLIKNNEPTVYITTYDMIKRDVENYLNINFRFVVLDEAQNIKNPSTLGSKSVKRLKRDNSIALTGTPIENSLKELWSIFDFIMTGYLYDLSEFQSIYATPIMNENDELRTTMLRHQISPFILRRFKKDVLLELPDKIETTLYADMTEEQSLAYTAFFKEAKGELMAHEETNQMNIIQKLTRLRQISCHPKLFIENYEGGSGKLDIVMETIKNCIEENHRILCFSQFTSMLDILKTHLDNSNIDYFYLDGKTKARDREAMCAKFNSGQKDIFLISLKAGGSGLNLTGADVVIHYDPWWNPSVMNQASDRAHRFGQKKVVQVFNVITKDTVEEKIYKLQDKKKALIDNVLTDEVKFINSLSKEELLKLFMD